MLLFLERDQQAVAVYRGRGLWHRRTEANRNGGHYGGSQGHRDGCREMLRISGSPKSYSDLDRSQEAVRQGGAEAGGSL